MALFGLFSRDKKNAPEAQEARQDLEKGLERSRQGVFARLTRAIAGRSRVDDDVLDELEEVLISGDVGVDTTLKIIKRVQERALQDKYVGGDELNAMLRSEIADLMQDPAPIDPARPGAGRKRRHRGRPNRGLPDANPRRLVDSRQNAGTPVRFAASGTVRARTGRWRALCSDRATRVHRTRSSSRSR